MKHCMIDLETLSTRPTASIVSIGACKFDFEIGIFDKFYINVSAHSCKMHGLHISTDTIEWWSKQSKEARLTWQKDPVSLQDALQKFLDWYGDKSMKTWSNGADFDLPIIANALLTCNLQVPWKYWDGSCVRTIQMITNTKVPRSDGTHHNALDDAVNQANYIISMVK